MWGPGGRQGGLQLLLSEQLLSQSKPRMRHQGLGFGLQHSPNPGILSHSGASRIFRLATNVMSVTRGHILVASLKRMAQGMRDGMRC